MLQRGAIWVALVLVCAGPGWGQFKDPSGDFLRTNPKFVAAFRDAVAPAAASTVRVQCDGKDTALGVIVGPDGWILTKANDLKGEITCKLKNGQVLEAEVAGLHQAHDLALLKVAARRLPAVVFSDSASALVGDWVACVGQGRDPTAFGVVSVATRNIPPNGEPPVFAPNAGYLGVGLEAGKDGVRITQVMPKTAADRVGLKAGDIIITVSGQAVRQPQEMIETMKKYKNGDQVTLKVRRGEKDMDVTAKLGPRPKSRGEIQNQMGSTLSSRRHGYPTVLQFDGMIRPTDCGGPLVNLDGQVIGLTISRAGRTENWAVPAEVIRPLLVDMILGEYPAASVPGYVTPKVRAAVNDLLRLMQRRLALMNEVARWKWSAKVSPADADREHDFLAKIQAQGKSLGLPPEVTRAFFAAQLEAGKRVQEQFVQQWKQAGRGPFPNVPDLKTNLRPQIDAVSQDMLAPLATLQAHLANPVVQKQLREGAETALTGAWITASVRESALKPLVK
jgi:serine protease Do